MKTIFCYLEEIFGIGDWEYTGTRKFPVWNEKSKVFEKRLENDFATRKNKLTGNMYYYTQMPMQNLISHNTWEQYDEQTVFTCYY